MAEVDHELESLKKFILCGFLFFLGFLSIIFLVYLFLDSQITDEEYLKKIEKYNEMNIIEFQDFYSNRHNMLTYLRFSKN